MFYQLIMQIRQNYKKKLLGLIFLMNLTKNQSNAEKVNQITWNFYTASLHLVTFS